MIRSINTLLVPIPTIRAHKLACTVMNEQVLVLVLVHIQTNFLFMAIPGLIAATAIFLVNLSAAVDGKTSKAQPVTLDTPIAT